MVTSRLADIANALSHCDDPRTRSVIAVEADDRRIGPMLREPSHHIWARAPKPIDALKRVGHDAHVLRLERLDQAHLGSIRVLELVDE